MSTWEERMSQRAKAKDAARDAREHAELDEANPRVLDEGEVCTSGRHRGHRTHCHPWHGSAVMCSCGAVESVITVALDVFDPKPEPCPVCIRRGLMTPLPPYSAI